MPVSRLRRGAWLLLIAGAVLPIATPDFALAEPRHRQLPAILLAQNRPAAPSTGAALPTAAAKPAAKSVTTASPPAGPPAGPLASPPPPKYLEPLPPQKYTDVLGQKVAGPDGEDLGLIVDVIVDVDGTPRAAVIDFGGFLGVGSRKIAVDWRLLNFAPAAPDSRIWLSLDRMEIQAAPEYQPDAASDEMVGPPWAAPPSPGAGK
jgi:hypothetical protein